MKEILFRGKRTDNGEWVYGVPIQYSNGTVVMCKESQRNENVVPETVGQYTGITDYNDKKIFDGDLVRLHYFFTNWDPSTLGRFEGEKTILARISINEYGVCFDGEGEHGFLFNYIEEPTEELEIIGNIYDGLEREE